MATTYSAPTVGGGTPALTPAQAAFISSGGASQGFGSGGQGGPVTVTNTAPAVTPAASTTPASTPISQSTIDAINAAINGAIVNNNQAAVNAGISNAADDANELGEYQGQEQTNTGARANAVQNAEQAAASGNQGLKAVLASLGALGGTGQVLAGRAVADSANSDIGGANTTYTDNNQAIQNANNAYTLQKNARDSTLANNLKTDNADAQTQGYQDLLNDAETQGDTTTYGKFLPALVAAATQPTQSLGPNPLVYTNAPTSSFAPTSSVNVTSAATQPGAAASQVAAQNAVTPVNSALYTTKTT